MDKSKEVKSRKLNIATNSVSDLTEDEEIQERPARKISLPERKISLPEYFPTSNPLVLAKSFAQIPEEDEIEREPTRKNSFPARKISFPSRNIPEYEEEESNWEPTRKNCFPDRKNSFPVRKISLPEYFPTSNPLVLAKSFSQISENEEFEDTFTEEKFRRKSHLPLPVSQPVKTRQRSHSVGVNVFDYNENHTDDIEQEDEMEFVGVKDEIMLIKGQFDKLLSVLNFKSEQSDEEKMIK